LVRLGADGLADAVSVLRPPLQRAEDEHVEGALQELQAAVVGLWHSGRQSTAEDVDCLRHVPGAMAGRFEGTNRPAGACAPIYVETNPRPVGCSAFPPAVARAGPGDRAMGDRLPRAAGDER